VLHYCVIDKDHDACGQKAAKGNDDQRKSFCPERDGDAAGGSRGAE
jgi:hypothetical protein